MKQLFIALLLAGVALGQTRHVTANLDVNNIFTGVNQFDFNVILGTNLGQGSTSTKECVFDYYTGLPDSVFATAFDYLGNAHEVICWAPGAATHPFELWLPIASIGQAPSTFMTSSTYLTVNPTASSLGWSIYVSGPFLNLQPIPPTGGSLDGGGIAMASGPTDAQIFMEDKTGARDFALFGDLLGGATGLNEFSYQGQTTSDWTVDANSPIVVNCSTSGTASFNEPLMGSFDKKVIVYQSACLGTAAWTFTRAFSHTPQIISQSLTSTIATSTTVVTVTGTTSTGFAELDGY